MREPEAKPVPVAPPRVLGGLGSFAVVAGSMLGIGIFLAPPIVARSVDSAWAFLAIWLVGGVTALGGAVACAELATMFPRSGGDYVFQREAYGPSVAFASGWVLLAAVFAGSIAAISVGLCTYQLPVLLGVDLVQPLVKVGPSWHVNGAQLVAIGLVILLTWVNTLGARPSGGLQATATLIPIVALSVAAVGVLLSPEVQPVSSQPAASFSGITMVGLVAAYLPVYFAYSGWNGVIYLAGEVRRPERTLPRSLIVGTLVVTGLYALMCGGFLKVLGIGGLAGVGEAGSASAKLLAGQVAEVVVTVIVAIALVASLNGSVLGSARVAFAMSRGGAFLSWVGQLHPRTGVPARALWLGALWAGLLILSNHFEQILSLVSVAMVVCGSLTVSALFVLRVRRPDLPRPYRAFGYPWLPMIYLAANAVVLVVMLLRVFSSEPGALYPLIGLGILIVTYVSHRVTLIGSPR